MNVVAEKLIAEFESLPVEEKQAFVKEILRRLPVFDSGPLDDNSVALAGDGIGTVLNPLSLSAPRPIGLAKGQFTVPDDFNAPLPDDVLQTFEGK